ncbi:hypothetical protein FRC09_000908 [Ceratobasidium sp. 395]|nr:hypothetical protein FRC09_000908 [Ceratobasidium sp. 395]
MEADSEMASGSTPIDVFGNVEPLRTPRPTDYTHEADSPPTSPLFTPARIVPARAGSRRTQSVAGASVVPRQPAVPSPLGPSRRKRGERDERRREKDSLRAELESSAAVAPGLALDPRIASDVLALERRFVVASKGKSPVRPHRTHAHRPRHSLPVNRSDLSSPSHAIHRANSLEHLAPLPESSTGMIESDTSPGEANGSIHASATVGPALPSSAASSIAPSIPSPPKSGPSPIRVDKPVYSSLLPNSDLEQASASASDVKRSKRTSLTAMFSLSRKKDKDKDPHPSEKESDQVSPPRPGAIRTDTHRTTRTMLTTHTSATAGSDDHSASGVMMSGSPMELSPAIEPSAKTLARAAATRDQLAKRYAILYAGIGGGDAGSMVSGSGSGSGSVGSKVPRGAGPGLNLLDVVRWRSANVQQKTQGRPGGEYERTDEIWEREIERRVRDYPPPTLGDSLPEATSLSWLPYLEPVFAEERGVAEEMTGPMGVGAERSRPMTAWYVLASFVEEYISSMLRQGEEDKSNEALVPTPRPMFTPTGSSAHVKVTSEVRAQAILNAANARTGDTNESPAKFGIIGALRTRSRQGSNAMDSAPGSITRARNGSVGFGSIGGMSEPPSPSHPTGHKWLAPAATGDVRASRSHSGSSQIHSRTHSRSQSQARSISGGNGGGSVDWGSAVRPGQIVFGNAKSTSPSSSRMNLANFIVGGATMFGLGLKGRRQAGGGLAGGEGVVSGSENESAGLSSDVVPSDLDVRVAVGRGGLSDGDYGRFRRRKKTGVEGEKGSLSDGDGGGGGGSGSGSREKEMRRRSWRPSRTVWLPVEVPSKEEQEAREKLEQEKAREEEREKEKNDERRTLLAEDAREVLSDVDARLQSFVQLAVKLNAVHHEGSDIFGEMFVAIPPDVVSTLAPDPFEEDGAQTRTPTSPLTPTDHTPLGLDALDTFARRLEGEEKPILVDAIGRFKLDANLPIRAFEVLHTFDHRLKDISNRVRDLRQICDDTEKERKEVKELYERTAENVETTYPECTQIERLLSSMITEDMPWLPSWLPHWVRHLLEIFSNQIQFLVENGLRIYGYIYNIASIIIFLVSVIVGVFFILGRFLRSIWWAFAIAGIAAVAYLMMRPPEGMSSFVEENL